jgi:16S rRNA processing protein RimM
MKNATTAYITIGKIGTTYGIHGWLKVRTYTDYGGNVLSYKPWYFSTGNDQWEQVDIEDGRMHGNTVIIKLAGINNPEEARLFTGKLIGITRQQLPKLKSEEYYWSDLVGMTVINKNGEIYGKVAYLIETGSNDVLVVKNDKDHAIPFLPGTVILNVDLEKQEIQVDWELI